MTIMAEDCDAILCHYNISSSWFFRMEGRRGHLRPC